MSESKVWIPQDNEQFRRELRKFLEGSHRNGVDIETGWAIYSDD